MTREEALKQLKQAQSQRILIVLNRMGNRPFSRSILCAETAIAYGSISRVLVALKTLGHIEPIGQKLYISYEEGLKLAQTAHERYPDLGLCFDPATWRLDYNRDPEAEVRGGEAFHKTLLWPEVFSKIGEMALLQNITHVEKRREQLLAARVGKSKR